MKMNKYLVMAFVAMSFVACSNEEDPINAGGDGNENSNASDAYAAFSISVPFSEAITRATDDGVAKENTVTSLHVFMYDVVAPYAPTVAEFSVSGGTLGLKQGTSNVWETSKAIKTKKADKHIFVGVNLNNDIVKEITSTGFGAFNYREFAQTVAQLTDGTNGFVMFNDKFPVVTPENALFDTETEAEAAHIQLSVDRTVAKAAVFKGSGFVVNGGGEMSNLSYGWRNINSKFYFVQKVDGGVIKDYNWDHFTVPVDYFVRGTDEIAVNDNGVAATEFSYALENTFDYSPSITVDEATYLSVSGNFRPDKVIALKGGVSTPQTGADFETVNNSSAPNSNFYVVRTNDGVANYFADDAVATAFANLCIAGANGMPSLTGPYDVSNYTYIGGKCYYHVFVNANATAAPYAPFNVYRNQYFKVTINSIQAPGNPGDNFDDGKPISTDAWIAVDIEVNPWNLIEENHDL